MSMQVPIEIGVVLYPDVQMAAVFGLSDLFLLANKVASQRDNNVPILRVSHWKLKDEDNTLIRVYDSHPAKTSLPNVLIVPPSLAQPISSEHAQCYVNCLVDFHQGGAILASVCAGAFLLVETGLLAGRTMTTHWLYAEEFAKRFPDVSQDIDQLIIDNGDILSAGGVMAWTDLGLRLVDRYLGAAVMIDTAQILLIDPPGQRQQRYYSAFVPRLSHGDEAILAVQNYLEEKGGVNVTLDEMAAYVHMQPRTFLRRFRKATGMTTTDYTQRLRVGRAREMLQNTVDPIETVAWQVGYSDPGAFRKVFTRIVGLTPSDYRHRFNSSMTDNTVLNH